VAEVAREPTFAPAELDRLRNQTLDALKVSYADPGRDGRPDRRAPGLWQRCLGASGQRHAGIAAANPPSPTWSPCNRATFRPIARC
jgi:hypothetical protein